MEVLTAADKFSHNSSPILLMLIVVYIYKQKTDLT